MSRSFQPIRLICIFRTRGAFLLDLYHRTRLLGQQSGRTCIGFFYTEHSRKCHMCDLDK